MNQLEKSKKSPEHCEKFNSWPKFEKIRKLSEKRRAMTTSSTVTLLAPQ